MKIRLIASLTALVLLIGLSHKVALAAPCSGLPSINRTISNEVCSIQSVVGVDSASNIETSLANGAPLTLQNASVTINPEAALVFGNLTIGDNVTIALAEGGQMLAGKPLYAEDKDADGWPSSLTFFSSTTSGRRRLSLMKSFNTIDCDDTPATGYDPLNMSGPWFRDLDGDGKGTASITQTGCVPPAGYITDNTDCNDGSALVWISHIACYADLDGDGFAGGQSATATCLNNASCNSATRASASTDVAAVTAYTAGRLLDSAPATVDCKDTGTSANLVAYTLTCYIDSDNDDAGIAQTRTCMNTASCATATYGSSGTTDDVVNVNFASIGTDCYDANANAKPGSGYCGTAHRGDGSYDYNCLGGNTYCGTAYYATSSVVSERCNKTNSCVASYVTHYTGGGQVGCGATGYTCTATGSRCYDCDAPGTDCFCSASTSYCTTGTAGVQSCQ